MRVFIFYLLLVSAPCSSLAADDWGFFGHKKINELAVYTLPEEIFGFYKYHMNYLITHAVDPDKRRYGLKGEAECHFLDVDRYYDTQDSNAWCGLPQRWDEAVLIYSEDSLRKHGIAPWNLYFVYKRLVNAFREGNIQRVLQLSAELGHYVGDIHVPLHTTSNYNGQQTNQRGIHGFWESRVPEIKFMDYSFWMPRARYVEDPMNFIWERLKESYAAVDSVLRMERDLSERFPSDLKYTYESRNGVEIRTYSHDYSLAYSSMLGNQVERRMQRAVYALGCLWYSAWIESGQPILAHWLIDLPPSPEQLPMEILPVREHE